MIILKHGDLEAFNNKLKNTYRFECHMCGCIWEANKGEYDTRYARYNEAEILMNCPCCMTNVEGKKKV